jgi:putative PIN family toxin of toxin-antitoxin system
VKIVLDTNVLVSALLTPAGPPAQILDLALAGKLLVLHDGRILLEYRDVLYRPKFSFRTDVVEPILEYFETEGEQVSAEPDPAEFLDEADRAFFEVAVSGEAGFLITGNRKHYPTDDRVASPAEFLLQYRRRRRKRH